MRKASGVNFGTIDSFNPSLRNGRLRFVGSDYGSNNIGIGNSDNPVLNFGSYGLGGGGGSNTASMIGGGVGTVFGPVGTVVGSALGSLVGGLFAKHGSDVAYQRLQAAKQSAQNYMTQGFGEMKTATNPYMQGNLALYNQGNQYAQGIMNQVQNGQLPAFMQTQYNNLLRQGTISGQGGGNPLFGSTSGEQTRSLAAQNMAGQAMQYAPNLVNQMYNMGAPMQQAGTNAINQYYGGMANAEMEAGGAGAQNAVNTGNIFSGMANTVGGIPGAYNNAIFGQQMMNQIPQMFGSPMRNNPGIMAY
jgi:hypothetical protein